MTHKPKLTRTATSVRVGVCILGGRIEILDEAECHQLLERAVVGRVGISVDVVPEILPVNFKVIGGAIVFRTGSGTKLHAATKRSVVAFEVDDFDSDSESGWSVLAVGVSEEVSDQHLAAELRAALLDGWVPGDRDHVIRMVPRRISGRRIHGF